VTCSSSSISRRRFVGSGSCNTLKVACPCQLEAVLKLLLGESIDLAVFHEDGTVAR
jgi:hypothetical protein